MAVDTTSQARAIARYIRMSPRKVRRVLDQIRGRSYREALIILEFMPYRACEPVLGSADGRLIFESMLAAMMAPAC